MLSTIKEVQDLLYQQWAIGQEPDGDIETQDGRSVGYVYYRGVFTGEIISHKTGDHICWCEPSAQGKAMADMIIAARGLYVQIMCEDNITGPDTNTFLHCFENFVAQNAGW